MARRSAEDAAQALLARWQITDLPTPIERLAELEGATIVRRPAEGAQSGFLYRDGSNKIIGVNSKTSAKRQRFTVAHEIGHLVLHPSNGLIVDHQIDNRDELSSLGIDQREIEANAFAAALLMPRDHVISQIRQVVQQPDVPRHERLILLLAKKFDVSSAAMSYRLINLGIYS